MALTDRYDLLLNKCVGSLKTWKTFINENFEGQDHDKEMKKLQQITKEYCGIDNNYKKGAAAIRLVDQTVSDPSENYNVDSIYEEQLAEQVDENLIENEVWQELFSNDLSIQEVRIKKKKDNSSYEEVDDSLMCSNSFTLPIDPISKVVIKQPIRNRKCGHVYDSQSIHEYIRQSRNKAKCPYVGCNNSKLLTADLQDDKQMEVKISQYFSSQASRRSSEEESD